MSAAFLQTLAVTVVMLLCACSIVSSHPVMSVVSGGCNVVNYTSGDPFEHSLHYLLPILETLTANQPEYDYYTQSPYPESVAYGQGFCSTSLTFTDCVTCISYVKEQLVGDCPNSIGAQLVLYDCQMRYEQYPFSTSSSGRMMFVDLMYQICCVCLLLFLILFPRGAML